MTLINPLPEMPVRPSISYHGLAPHQQDGWHRLEALCDQPGVTAHEIVDFNAIAAALLGIRLRDGGQLAKCDCEACPDDCDAIYDLDEGIEYRDGNLQRPQCPSCVADHRQVDA